MLPDLNIGRQQSQPLLAQPSTDNPKKPKRRQADLF